MTHDQERLEYFAKRARDWIAKNHPISQKEVYRAKEISDEIDDNIKALEESK